jgi:hypothetical protein
MRKALAATRQHNPNASIPVRSPLSAWVPILSTIVPLAGIDISKEKLIKKLRVPTSQ